MTTIPLLSAKRCYPCCWFAKEKRCHCECHGANHGRLNPNRPQNLTHATTVRGQTYQNTLFQLSDNLERFTHTTSPKGRKQTIQRTTIDACSRCKLPTAARATGGTAPQTRLCPACKALRAAHRPFTLRKQGRLSRGIPTPTQAALAPVHTGDDKPPCQEPAQHNDQTHTEGRRTAAPWFLLP